MSQSQISRGESKWRREVVSDVLGHKLDDEGLEEALRICNEDFTTEGEFTASGFCHRLTEARPELELGKKTRLLLLHEFRHHDVAPEPEREQQTLPSSPIEPQVDTPPSENLQQGVPERRRDFRKLTNLVGVYWHTLDKRKDGAMIVENLSISGCGLRILTPHDLKRGDTIRLEFKLDDGAESFIRIHGQLRWVLYDLVGIEFQSLYGMPQVLADYIAS